MESVEDLARDGYYVQVEPEVAVANLIKGLGKGVLKVMSKMGVSTVASYTGAQIFEAVGLSAARGRPLLHRHDLQARRHRLDTIAEEVARRHATAYPRGGISPTHRELDIGGEYQWRRRGASRTCSTPRRSSGCSTPRATGATTSSSSTPRASTSSPSG